jgi:hypothetical protein
MYYGRASHISFADAVHALHPTPCTAIVWVSAARRNANGLLMGLLLCVTNRVLLPKGLQCCCDSFDNCAAPEGEGEVTRKSTGREGGRWGLGFSS